MQNKVSNYLLKIEYDGTEFVGWQYQKNGRSVQGRIEKVLFKILKSKTRIVGAGRTDKGVHAINQYANFKTKKKIVDKKKFIKSLNFFLKDDKISILKIYEKNLNFSARFNAKKRVYIYIIINRESPLSLDKNRAWHIQRKLNINLLKRGAKILKGKHDFSTFRASSCTSKSPIKNIQSVMIKKIGDKICISFKSQSFLQNQVRSMVGCLKNLSAHQWSIKKFKKVLKSKNRQLCAVPAPACGLYLAKVIY